jgi:hypothetical protein
MKKWPFVALLLAGATILGTTVLREPIASAAQHVSATIVGPLDANGNVKVHEQGTANVNVTGSPTVHAAQQGAWNVGLTGTPTVTVATPDLIQRLGFIHIDAGDDTGLASLFTVPAGKRLIIVYVNAEVDTAPGAHVLLRLDSPQFAIDHFLTLTDQGVLNGVQRFVGGEVVNYFYRPGDEVFGDLLRGPNTNAANAQVGFTGYLVDAP